MSIGDRIGKFSPIQIPKAFRQRADSDGDDDPLTTWDASDWENPDSSGLMERIVPSHAGQALIMLAVVTILIGIFLWLTKFFPPANANPWTLVGTLWPASIMVAIVLARESGFAAVGQLDYAIVQMGKSIEVIAGKFVKRFGNAEHIAFTPLKSRSYGAFSFNYLKLGDLNADRENLISKATGSNRGPDSHARVLLPGALTAESSNTVLGRVFGVHGGSIEFHDSGQETDMRVTNPDRLDDEIAANVLNQLEMYDQRIIPELMSELHTLETLKNRYQTRAQAERDPEMERLFEGLNVVTGLLNRRGRTPSSREGEDDDIEAITENAREAVGGDS